MSGSPAIPLWLSTWCLALSVPLAILLSVLSALLDRSGPIRLRHWAEEAGGNLRRLNDRPARFEAFRFLVSVSAKVMSLVVVTCLWLVLLGYGWDAGWQLVAAPAAVAMLLLVVEWINRRLVTQHAEGALEVLTVVLRVVWGFLSPGVWLLAGLMAVPETSNSEEEEEDEASEEELDAFIDVGLREGILEPEEEELVRSIVDFGDTLVKSVMTPRVEIKSVAQTASLEQLADAFFEWKHARLPIHGESIDQIVGIVHIRDLFYALHSRRETDAVELSNPPHYVPESKPLPDLLEELQTLQQQMAIVVDEYGGVAGLVTVEDLVEEIVGEIADEHEKPRRQRVRLDEDRWRVRGRIPLEELGDLFELDLDDLPYETASGLICGELGYVPKSGDVIETHGLSMAIEEADERRVKMIAVQRTATEPAEKVS